MPSSEKSSHECWINSPATSEFSLAPILAKGRNRPRASPAHTVNPNATGEIQRTFQIKRKYPNLNRGSKLQHNWYSVTQNLPCHVTSEKFWWGQKAPLYRCYEHGLPASHSWGYCRAPTGSPGGWCGWWEAGGHHTGTNITSRAARCQRLNTIKLLCTTEGSLKLHFMLISSFKLRDK